MPLQLIKNCKLFNKNQQEVKSDILTDTEKILEVGNNILIKQDIEIIDAAGNYVTPGFIDLQVNGGEKVFFNNDISAKALHDIYNAHNRLGTRFFLPTLITSSHEKIFKAIDVVRTAMAENEGILGLHLEGPFLNKEKKGGHNPNIIRLPTDYELDEIMEKGNGVVKKLTIAPEIFSVSQLEKLVSSGIIISAGHSNATYAEAIDFFGRGVNCVTHLYNAMSAFTGRDPGLVGAVLNTPVYAGIIVDGVHAHYSSAEIAYKLKKDKLFLVSDASFTNVVEDGEKFSFEGMEISVKNGNVYNAAGSLAGASITMIDAIRNCVDKVNIAKAEAIKMATEIPALLLYVTSKLGRIEVGCSAKLNIVDEDLCLVQVLN